MAVPNTREEYDAWEQITRMLIDDARGRSSEDEEEDCEESGQVFNKGTYNGFTAEVSERPVKNVKEAKQHLNKIDNVQRQLDLISASTENCRYMLQRALKREEVPVNLAEMFKEVSELMEAYRYFLNEKIDNAVI